MGISAFLNRTVVHRILQINDTPHAIGLGASIGMFLAMTPTVGIQIIVATIVCTVIRANRIAAIALVFVSNPLTMVPIYWVDYWVGARITGDRMISRQEFEAIWQRIADAGIIGGIREAALALTGEVFAPMMIGGSILGLLLALPLYPVTVRAARAHRHHRDRRHALMRLRDERRRAREAAAAPPREIPVVSVGPEGSGSPDGGAPEGSATDAAGDGEAARPEDGGAPPVPRRREESVP